METMENDEKHWKTMENDEKQWKAMKTMKNDEMCITCGASPAVHHLQYITCSASFAEHHLPWLITDSSSIIIFDILESYHFQKYGTCWVFESFCLCLCLCLGVDTGQWVSWARDISALMHDLGELTTCKHWPILPGNLCIFVFVLVFVFVFVITV